jgi:hypothetical protein
VDDQAVSFLAFFPLSLSFCLPFSHDSFGFCCSVSSVLGFRFTLFFVGIFRHDRMQISASVVARHYCAPKKSVSRLVDAQHVRVTQSDY